MEYAWEWLTSRCSPFVLYTIVPTILVNLVYAIGVIVCLSFDSFPSLAKYKLQRTKHTTSEKFWHCVKMLVLIKLGCEIPMTLAAYPTFKMLGISYATPLPPAWLVLVSICGFFFVEDAWHYCGHRLLHTAWGFKKIHYMHHEYSTPFGASANYAHPAETIILGFGTILPVLIFRPHLFTLIAWVLARQVQAIGVHCGYDFPCSPARFIPFVGGARSHDRHHTKYRKNYAPMFTYLDRLFGTAAPALATQAEGAAARR